MERPLFPLKPYVIEFDRMPKVQILFKCVYIFVTFMHGEKITSMKCVINTVKMIKNIISGQFMAINEAKFQAFLSKYVQSTWMRGYPTVSPENCEELSLRVCSAHNCRAGLMANCIHSPQFEGVFDRKRAEGDYFKRPLDLGVAAKILAADAISRNFKREQNFGDMLTEYLREVSGESVFSGFSHYSELSCNISRVGSRHCNKALSKRGACAGMGF